MSNDRTVLEQHSLSLRKELKAWEKQFSKENAGKKPAREDIKADADIGERVRRRMDQSLRLTSCLASKYKEYDRIREVLSGKSVISKPSTTDRKRKRNGTIQPPSPKRSRFGASTPRKQRTVAESHESQLSPIALSPVVKPAMIGPTPQKDGKFLGMFDLMSPDKRHDDPRTALTDVSLNIAATPSKMEKPSRSLEVTIPARGSRTPASSSKRFFLENFITPTKRERVEDATPSSSRKLFATPSFLRRDTVPLAPITESPEAPRVFQRRPFGRSLSSRMEELRKEKDSDQHAKEDVTADASGDGYEDDLEAMREMEDMGKPDVPKIIVEDSQAGVTLDIDGFVPSDLEEDSDSADNQEKGTLPKKSWKKKGLKRQTKRVIMRPTPIQQPTKETDGEQDAPKEVKRKSKPNALAHANFRRLKIKNKNSRAKGKFSRRR